MADERTIQKALNLITQPAVENVAAIESARAKRRVGAAKIIGSAMSKRQLSASSQQKHIAHLRGVLASKNVVGVGIAEKQVAGKKTGKLALTFYVERKRSLKSLKGTHAIPPAIAESLSGPQVIPTDVVALGRLKLEVNAARTPIQPGNSVGHIQVTAGTVGAIVQSANSSNGKAIRHILSNSHVLAKGGIARIGDAILYPGRADGGRGPEDRIAKLSRFVRFQVGGAFVNTADCATARVDSSRAGEVEVDIKGLGPPAGTTTAKRGMTIVKVGRTTGKTTGVVRDVHFRFVLKYPGVGSVGFLDQVLCTRYSKPGDSGSLVLDAKTKKAVGLHFAGANGGSVFSPIDQVLGGLEMKLSPAKPRK